MMAGPLSADSPNPAVAAAASAKAEESAAPQKIKALKYLGSLGCGGCHPEVEQALLAALDDCMEVIRFEAVSVLADTSRCHCRYCDSGRCCSPAIRKKLIKIATDTRNNGCFVEPSARVRRMARIALCNCECDSCDLLDEEILPVPEEGPSSEGIVPPPAPQPAITLKSRPDRPSTLTSQSNPQSKSKGRDQDSEIETADFAGEDESPPNEPAKTKSNGGGSSNGIASANELIAKSKGTVSKPYDKSRQQPEIVIKTIDPRSRASKQTPEVARSSISGLVQDKKSPRVRWERSAISIYRFETKEAGLAAMEFLRQKARGEATTTQVDPNLKYLTTREVGWTRPQDVRSSELAKLLFELPIGEISHVLEVGDVLLVCRVLERESPESADDDN